MGQQARAQTMGRLMAALVMACAAYGPYAARAAEAKPSSSYLQMAGPNYTAADIWANHKHLPNWEEMQRVTADTWPYLPKNLDPAYKNPCWTVQENGNSVLKCMPYFQILGVSKCGTTDLYHRLTFHPDLIDCGFKSPHFWDESWSPNFKASIPGRFAATFPDYVSMIFDKPAAEIKQDPARRITGEASSNTFTGVLTYVRGLTTEKQTNVTLAQHLWEAAPWSRFIVMLRDPVDRYYSAYNYYKRELQCAATPENFHVHAKADIFMFKRCLLRADEARCLQLYQPQQLVKGLYGAFLPHWLAVWPKDRLMLLRSEEYAAEPVPHMLAVMDFLGLRRVPEDTLGKALGMTKRNVQSYPEMLPATRKMLEDFYRPYNQRLSAIMENDARWLWGY